MSRNSVQTLFYAIDGGGQSVAYTGTAGTISNAVAAQTYAVLVWCSTDAYVVTGSSPTATTADLPLPANIPVILKIRPGEKVSAVQISSGGTLYVGELTH